MEQQKRQAGNYNKKDKGLEDAHALKEHRVWSNVMFLDELMKGNIILDTTFDPFPSHCLSLQVYHLRFRKECHPMSYTLYPNT